MKQLPVLLGASLLAGCASGASMMSCDLEASDLDLLKSRTIEFLEATWHPIDASCEQLADQTQHVSDFGCGIYGMPAGSSSPGCPDMLDGDYFVIFDPETLEPTEVVPIAH